MAPQVAGSSPAPPTNTHQEVAYATAPSREDVLNLFRDIAHHIPVDWSNPSSVKAFKNASDAYAKAYGRLSWEDQGWVGERISTNT